MGSKHQLPACINAVYCHWLCWLDFWWTSEYGIPASLLIFQFPFLCVFRYYYIYHPRNAQRWIRKQNRLGQAMGFMDSDSDSGDSGANQDNDIDEKIFVNEVLSGLSLWMDRVFDGSVRKVRIDYWPEMSEWIICFVCLWGFFCSFCFVFTWIC